MYAVDVVRPGRSTGIEQNGGRHSIRQLVLARPPFACRGDDGEEQQQEQVLLLSFHMIIFNYSCVLSDIVLHRSLPS